MLKPLALFSFITTGIISDPALASLEGIDVSVQNTIQAPFTQGLEDNFGDQVSTTVSPATI